VTSGQLRVAVVGSGPAGVYAAHALTAAASETRAVTVDVIDRLPTPYGLVRYGVAPDHLKIKSITRNLHAMLDLPSVRFLGNVAYGADVDLAELRARYHAVVFATGSPHDRRLGVPGEDLPGSTTAVDVVAWYSGHPDATVPPLHAREVAVVGAGNVALDVARVLAKGAAGLAHTDMPEHVHTAFGTAAVSDVHIVIRRGPAQVRFTPLELREMGALAGVDVVVDPDDLVLDAASEQAVNEHRATRTMVELLREWSQRPGTHAPRRVHFHFFRRPTAILGNETVSGLQLERCAPDGTGGVRGTGATEVVPAQLVVRAIGYRGAPISGLPFDEATATVPNDEGRVGGALSGCYVAGWIKRGPTGVIGTNKADAAQTVRTILADLDAGRLPPPTETSDLLDLLDERGVAYALWDGWLRIDAHEVELGTSSGRERTKVGDLETMVRLSRARSSSGGSGPRPR